MENKEEYYTFERANEQNIVDLSLIFFETTGKVFSVEFLKSKFNTVHSSLSYIGYFAYTPEKKPAAFYGLFPCYIMVNNEIILSAQSGDTITHIDHQKKGLFVKLALKTYELAQQEGIKILFGFPNKNSFPGFIKNLNWNHVNNLNVYRFRSNCLPIYRLLSKLKLRSLYNQYSGIVLRKTFIESSEFNGSIPRNSVDSVHRDADFYKYKKFASSFFIEFEGLRIWAKIDNSLLIGDISSSNNLSTEDIVKILKKLTARLGLNEFIFEVSQGSYWDERLSKIHTPIIGSPVIIKNLDANYHVNSLEFTGGDIDIF